MFRVPLLFLFGLLTASPVLAQSQAVPGPALGYAQPTETPRPAWEARLGLGAADLGGREGGLLNFGGEFLTPRAVQLDDRFSGALVPRFHIGSSLNFNGTRYAYAGATWTVDLSKTVFVEASLGAAVNDGKTGPIVPENRLNLGCNAGARGPAAVGVRLGYTF